MPPRSLYYSHSGEGTSPARIAMMLLIGALTGAGVGLLYGFVSFYNPLIYITVLINFGAAALTGMAVVKFAKARHIRSASIVMFCVLAAGLLGVYFNWVAYIFNLSGHSLLVVNPLNILRVLAEVSKEGVWSIKGSTPTGLFLLGIWLCEALLFIIAAFITARKKLKSIIYCETCRHWLDSQSGSDHHLVFSPLSLLDHDKSFHRSLERADMSPLTSLTYLEPTGEKPFSYLKLEVDRCLKCEDMTLLSVMRTTEKKKESDNETKNLVHQLFISNESLAEIRAALARPESPPHMSDEPLQPIAPAAV